MSNEEGLTSGLPGLPCWIGTSSVEWETGREGADSDAVSQGAPAPWHRIGVFVVGAMLVLVLLVALRQVRQEDLPLPLWLSLVQLLPVWSVFGTWHGADRWAHTVAWRARDKPRVLLDGAILRGYVPGQVRDQGICRSEDIVWPWQLFAGYEFRGEADGFFVMRLVEHPAPENARAVPDYDVVPIHLRQVAQEALPHRTWGRRLQTQMRLVGVMDVAVFVARVLPLVATAAYFVDAFMRAGWRADALVAFCLLMLHVLWLMHTAGEARWGRARSRLRLTARKKHLYLLFDCRRITAQEALRRIDRSLGELP